MAKYHVEHDPIFSIIVVIVLLFWLLVPHGKSETTNLLEINSYSRYIERWEGRKARPYRDTTGNLTVGVGHKLEKTEKVKPSYSEAEINRMLRDDTLKAVEAARRNVRTFDKQPEHVKKIIVDLNYQNGEANFRKFRKTIKAIDEYDYETASKELKRSKWYTQSGQRSRNHVQEIKE